MRTVIGICVAVAARDATSVGKTDAGRLAIKSVLEIQRFQTRGQFDNVVGQKRGIDIANAVGNGSLLH
jgi:hypothetical protein